MSTATKSKPTAYESKWEEIVHTVSYGQPVLVRGYRRMSVVKGIQNAKLAMASQNRRVPEHGLNTHQISEREIRVTPRQWQYRTPTPEQRQAIEAFAASDMPELFVGGLAGMDVDAILQEITSATGVQFRTEYAFHHLPDGLVDRACWIVKGGE